MIVIGVLLILIAVGAVAFALMAPSGAVQTIEVTALGFKVSASPLAMFFAGAAVVVLLSLGFAMVSRGTRRKASSRKELRQLRKEQAATGPGPGTPVAAEQSSGPDRPEHTSGTATGNTDSTQKGSTNTDSESPSPR
jgi:hypothetical protein